MNPDERAVTSALQQIATQARPARVPDDLWARGRRRRRLRRVASITGIGALMVAATVALTWAPPLPEVPPAEDERSIPSEIHAPIPLQPKLVDAPNGPASVIVTGPGGFGAIDLFGYDDRAIVVGRDGLYRYVRTINGFTAGEDLLLSPDGRYVAAGPGFEGVDNWERSVAAVMDLVTGELRVYREGRPVAWSPDGRLLTSPSSTELRLVDLGSGGAVSLTVGDATAFAFSPDGRHLAVQVAQEIRTVDLRTRAVRVVAELAEGQTLAGPGAFSAGRRLAVWDRSPCLACPANVAMFRLSFVDVDDGSITPAPFDAVRAVSASLLGWQADGDAVVVLAMTAPVPEGPHTGAPQVLALHPDGGQTPLITVTSDADRIDIARDLLDHFGGPSRSDRDLLRDMLRVRIPQALVPIAVIVLLVGAGLIYRRVRDGVWPWLPREFRTGSRR